MKSVIFKEPHWVYDNKDGRRINIINKDTQLVILKEDNGWIQHMLGWSRKTNDMKFVESDTNNIPRNVEPIIMASTDNKPKDNNNNTDQNKPSNSDDSSQINYKEYWSPFTSENKSDFAVGGLLKNMNGIFGLPYQYMASVDRRLSGTNYGRLYGEKIISRMPLLLMSPGKVDFMGGYSDDAKKDLITAMQLKDDSALNDIMSGKEGGSLYQFGYNLKEYYQYVNSLCSMLSVFLGIQDISIAGSKLGTMQWNKQMNPQIANITGEITATSVAFYLDAETQVSESYSNTTKDSMLQSMVDGFSDTMQQILFLVGGVGGGKVAQVAQEGLGKAQSVVQGFVSKFQSILPSKTIDFLDSSVQMILSGGKMALPELWSDSSVNNSYDISIKLRTPDNDNVSWFLNIGVPLIHLLTFVLPVQATANSYNSPFLIRAYYKSIFHVQMGIITSMNIRKGDKGKWTINGLPTEVDIQFSIKDLYDYLTLSLLNDPGAHILGSMADMYKNSAMTDYLAVLAGININKPDILRTIELYKTSILAGGKNLITLNGAWLGLKDDVNDILAKMFDKL